MIAMLGASIFSIIIIVSFLIICGLPLGELTMGGKYKVFPKKLRFLLVGQLIFQMLFLIILLQAGGWISLWFSDRITKTICKVMAIYLILNTCMNLVSKSKKERYIMTPLSAISAICFWMTALSIGI